MDDEPSQRETASAPGPVDRLRGAGSLRPLIQLKLGGNERVTDIVCGKPKAVENLGAHLDLATIPKKLCRVTHSSGKETILLPSFDSGTTSIPASRSPVDVATG